MAKTKKRRYATLCGYQRKQVPVFCNGCSPPTRRDLFDILLDTVTGSHGMLLSFIYVVMCAYSGPYRQYSANNGMHDPAGPPQGAAASRGQGEAARRSPSGLTAHQPPATMWEPSARLPCVLGRPHVHFLYWNVIPPPSSCCRCSRSRWARGRQPRTPWSKLPGHAPGNRFALGRYRVPRGTIPQR